MAQIHLKPKLDFELSFIIDKDEALGLDALVGYDFDAFIKVFKNGLGKHYLERPGAEEGLRKFFMSVRQFVPGYLEKYEKAKREFK